MAIFMTDETGSIALFSIIGIADMQE